jgi:hypothetical protein
MIRNPFRSDSPRVVIVASLLLVVVVSVVVAFVVAYEPASCDDLTAEILTMTGPDATEDYDVDRVREINEQRQRQGCPTP